MATLFQQRNRNVIQFSAESRKTISLGAISAASAKKILGHIEQAEDELNLLGKLSAETLAWMRGVPIGLRRKFASAGLLPRDQQSLTVSVSLSKFEGSITVKASTLTFYGTGVFLDPPYRKELACGKKNRASHIYANDRIQDVNALCDEVQDWCLRWGDNPLMRIALCGLEGEYPAIESAGWTKVEWKSRGGYGNRSERGKENAARERVWFSPHCVTPEDSVDLFSMEAA